MYAITMQLYAASGPQLNTDIYEKVAETYHLPFIESLIISLEQDIEWNVEPATQIYYLENLREANRRVVFQIRFKTNPDAHEHTALFVSIDDQKQVHNISLQFPSRGDRHCSAKIVGWLKDIQKLRGGDIEFELAGYGESDRLRYIREHSLSAFQWHQELKRYLHVTDHPQEVRETRKGMTRL